MSVWWTIKWAIIGFILGGAVIMPIAAWVWTPPDLLGVVFGGVSVMTGWVIGAWWEDRKP